MKKACHRHRRPQLQRVERRVPTKVHTPSRTFRLQLRNGLHIDVVITRNPRWMREAARRLDKWEMPRTVTAGVHWLYRRTGPRGPYRRIATPRRRLARAYFNERDLLRCGTDTVAHESTHLAMLSMRRQRHDVLADEEPLAELVGDYSQAITRILRAHGVRWTA